MKGSDIIIDKGNKKLRKSSTSTSYVIIAIRDGVEKYVSKGMFRKGDFDFTVKINKAKRFYNESSALRCIEDNELDAKIAIITTTIELNERK